MAKCSALPPKRAVPTASSCPLARSSFSACSKVAHFGCSSTRLGFRLQARTRSPTLACTGAWRATCTAWRRAGTPRCALRRCATTSGRGRAACRPCWGSRPRWSAVRRAATPSRPSPGRRCGCGGGGDGALCSTAPLQDGRDLRLEQDMRRTVHSGGDLVITDLQALDAGFYTCVARNMVGTRETESAKLTVYGTHPHTHVVAGCRDQSRLQKSPSSTRSPWT